MSIVRGEHYTVTDYHSSYEGKIQDFNFGSLIRTDCREEYGERNTIFGLSNFYILPGHHTDASCSHSDAGVISTSFHKLSRTYAKPYIQFYAFEV
jgi:hypothetical protein